MISSPDILTTQAIEAAIIPLTVPRADMPKVFGPAVGELFATLAAQGIAPCGAVFAHHLRMPPGLFEFNLGVAVSRAVQPAGRVVPGALPAAQRVAHTTYTGPYEGLHGAWSAFDAWLAQHGHAKAEDLWEIYTLGPDKTPNPAEWRTELYRPLKT